MPTSKKRYRITRINGIAGKHRPKRVMTKKIRKRYLAKSFLVRCDFSQASIEFVNFRGALIKACRFKNATLYGVEFWGTNLNDSDFSGATLTNVLFVGAKINKCNFNNTMFKNVVFINTNISRAKNLQIVEGIKVLNEYPKIVLPLELWNAIDDLKENEHFRKTKILHLSGNRYNEYNILLLLKKFDVDELVTLLKTAKNAIKKDMVTYLAMEKELIKLL